MPSVGGFATQLTFPAATPAAATTLSVTTLLDAPANAVSLQSKVKPQATSTTDVLYYLIFTPASTITYPTLPSVSMTLPSTTPTSGRNFYASISIAPETGSELSFLTDGPASVTNQTVTFAADPHSLTLQAGKQYVYAFYDTRANAGGGLSIHVADTLSNAIYTFPLGTDGDVAPSSVLRGPLTGLNQPIAIAEDAQGRVYVLNGGATAGAPGVTIYSAGASGNVSPVFVIPESAAHDTIGGKFTNLIDADAIAVTPSSNTLYTEQQFGTETGSSAGVVTWTRNANGSYSSSSGPSEPSTGGQFLGLALDPSGNVYQESNSLQLSAQSLIFGPGIIAKNGVIGGSLTTLTSLDPIAVSPTGGEVCAVDAGRVPCFATSSVGNIAPTRQITSSGVAAAYTLSVPGETFGITYDPAGELLVTLPASLTGVGAVVVFAPNASGSVSPVRTIAGLSTQLTRPAAIVVGP